MLICNNVCVFPRLSLGPTKSATVRYLKKSQTSCNVVYSVVGVSDMCEYYQDLKFIYRLALIWLGLI